MSINSILVVCIGNICRSPMAQALFSDALPNATVVSAGTGALIGEPADAMAQQLMVARGLNISAHRAQQVSRVLCQHAGIIFVMDQAMRRHLEGQYPFATGKVFRLGEFSKMDIPDPYRQSQEMFEHSLRLIETGVSTWNERINKL